MPYFKGDYLLKDNMGSYRYLKYSSVLFLDILFVLTSFKVASRVEQGTQDLLDTEIWADLA